MNYSDPKEAIAMKCSIDGCPPSGRVPLYEFAIIWFVSISARKATRMEKEDYNG